MCDGIHAGQLLNVEQGLSTIFHEGHLSIILYIRKMSACLFVCTINGQISMELLCVLRL